MSTAKLTSGKRQTDKERQRQTETERGGGGGGGRTGEHPRQNTHRACAPAKARATGEECLNNKPEQIFSFSSIALI